MLTWLFILTVGGTQAQQFESHLRMQYVHLTNDEAKKNYVNISQQFNPTSPLEAAYQAAGKALSAEFAVLPTTKWKLFQEATETLDQLILRFPTNLEMRFIRFSLQVNAPSFLGYHNNKEEDLGLIHQAWKNKQVDIHNPYWSSVQRFILNTTEISSTIKHDFNP